MISIKSLSKRLAKWLLTVFADIRSAIVGALVLYLLSTTGILFLINKVWHGLQKPIPLWLLIVILLSVLFLCSISFLIHSYKVSNKPHSIVHDFTIGNFKWRVEIYKSGYFEVEKYPFCIKHDQRFIFRYGSKYCPGTESEKCGYELRDSHFFEAYESAKSIIEKKVRNKTY